jgi:hypothetical protein
MSQVDPAKIAALQQAYKSALPSVSKVWEEEILRNASAMFAAPLEVDELCLASVLEQIWETWGNGHLVLGGDG